ncbi:preprotein translocase subunit SecY [Desulfurivibrio alkaliphilus]|uniref:Protein translocase subunit SecY n=1 Tax=Desulfurivibrio alkaliphilus (strain DSM 19089 / UNIQEM U267 / AHT2) TaxID=589865 RepID=D6Z3K2_DESAT|nr:preprotein translocase subunit SecY [Desulfurivibrio alkaliphilus]ADH86127.1 preprotein translocase, SecY subunit [Desulfurivibrio alkaliphilus AHT 2]
MQAGVGSAAGIPELRRRIFFTLAMLAVYRAGVQVPTPGVNGEAITAFFEQVGGLFDMFNMFSGGALENFSIFALGIMPYISASIIFQLLTVVVPYLEALKKEGESGRQKITQYTRYATIGLAMIQGIIISIGLEGMTAPGELPIVIEPGWGFRLTTMITLTCGTAFVMWLGEQMTERGIGNGISLIIYAGILASMPAAIANTFQMAGTGELPMVFLPLLLVMVLAVTGFIVFVETAQRRIPVQYAKRMVGRRMYGGQQSHLPLKVNMAGVIPAIFASSLMMFPETMGNFIHIDWVQRASAFMAWGSLPHTVVFVVFLIFFCFFYVAVTFNPVDVADNLKRNGGFVPGVRPGKKTADFLDKVITRLTVVGAAYMSAICVLPTVLINEFNVPFYFGGTALLIVVVVSIDTIGQIESHTMMRNYDGFLKQGRFKGRR